MENLKKQLPKLQRTIQFMDSDLFKKCEIKVEGGGTNENGELVFVEFEINSSIKGLSPGLVHLIICVFYLNIQTRVI